ncbi:hypothetical protein Poli38472_005964 [Pythium oligandrum]|uniref:1-phosphatidylinositol 4-kinase n=1 Tax=Pythium oligandrum TaxID=41045 RepID=A0A8K1CRI8_PYTOL|nr:hypothetical protein Poli38472_005964 [Pythium oligandrum]|eukprot:TMW68496.1 hypothetical protein Poli38472_005964 [Pythium oligandrum]
MADAKASADALPSAVQVQVREHDEDVQAMPPALSIADLAVDTDASVTSVALSRAVSTSSTSAASPSVADTAAAVAAKVEVDGFGVKGFLSMRDEGVTYHRMKRYYCRSVGVNFYRFNSRESASAMINAVFSAEIERIEPWDGRGLFHTYRHSFKLYFTNGAVFNADADNEDDKSAWIEYIDTAIKGATHAKQRWHAVTGESPEILVLTTGGLAFVDANAAGSSPKFKNQPTCGHPTCSAKFESAGKRQHHCRNCGGSVCSDHSSRFAVLRHYQMNDAVRLCTNCYRVQRFIVWLSMLVQRLSMAQVEAVKPRALTPAEQEEMDALDGLLSDPLVGISDVIQILHLHRQGPDAAYSAAVDKLLSLSATNLMDFEFFLPQIFHMWLTLDWTTNTVKAALLFRVVNHAARLHVRFATSLYWLARASVDDSCGWGFGQSELSIPDYLFRKMSICKLLMVNLEQLIFKKEWRFEADNDIPASELQTSMIRCLFDRLSSLLGDDNLKPSVSYGPVCEAVGALAIPREYLDEWVHTSLKTAEDESTEKENRQIFQTQLQFIQELCDMTERLRKITPEERKPALRTELAQLTLPDNSFCPLGSCEDALLRFLTIVRDEGTVFTTKARAPTLIFFEVERLSSFDGKNPWLQRAVAPEMTYDDFDGEEDVGRQSNAVMGGRQSMPYRQSEDGFRAMNAIEMATSSAIAQALPQEALDEDGADDRTSEAIKFKRSDSRGVQKHRTSLAGLGPEPIDDDEDEDDGEVDIDEDSDEDEDDSEADDEDDDDDNETRDRVPSNPRPSLITMARDVRRRSGSLMAMSRPSLDSLMSVYTETMKKSRRKRSISEGNEKKLVNIVYGDLRPTRHEFEKFTADQLMTMAQNLEQSIRESNPSAQDMFSGLDILTWMKKTEIVVDEAHAQWLAEEMLTSGVLERVNVDGPKSKTQFVPTAEAMYQLKEDAKTKSIPPASASSPSAGKAQSPQENDAIVIERRSSAPGRMDSFSHELPSERTVASQSSRPPHPTTPHLGSSVSTISQSRRLISPRKTANFSQSSIADAIGGNFSSGMSPRATETRSSQFRDSSVIGSGNDEQRSVVSTSHASSLLNRFQPEVTTAALESIEQALEQHVFNQPALGSSEHLRQDLRALREQLEIVSEYVTERKKRRHQAVESAFGESFEEKRERLRKSSRHVHLSLSDDWDCVAFIVKSNDDLRQEVLCLQLIRQFEDIFQAAELPLRLLPYRIIATSASTGMIEYIKNATSLDGLKKRPGYTTLANHFIKTYGNPETGPYKAAMANYVRSMAAYSLVCYFLQIKDRHNGNIMIDSEGHVVHIDFGFILGIAPGGRFSLETAPFKLTAEMVDAMGGTQSEYFKAYVILLIQGFLALQQHADTILLMIAIMAQESSCPCFLSQNPRDVLNTTKHLFKLHMNQNQVIKHVLSLVRRSHRSYRTRQYDVFQKLTNGILP